MHDESFSMKLNLSPRVRGSIGTATQPILRTIGRVVGSDVLADSVAFFQAFAGMETGFRERADDVVALLPENVHAGFNVNGPIPRGLGVDVELLVARPVGRIHHLAVRRAETRILEAGLAAFIRMAIDKSGIHVRIDISIETDEVHALVIAQQSDHPSSRRRRLSLQPHEEVEHLAHLDSAVEEPYPVGGVAEGAGRRSLVGRVVVDTVEEHAHVEGTPESPPDSRPGVSASGSPSPSRSASSPVAASAGRSSSAAGGSARATPAAKNSAATPAR